MIFNEIKKAVQSALDFLHPIIDSKEPKTFKGTSAEWSNLTPTEQAAYEVKYITDDVSAVLDFHYQRGTVSSLDFAPNERKDCVVTLSTTMPDIDYVVTINTHGSTGSLFPSVWNKTTSGFIVTMYNANATALPDQAFDWQAFKIPQ